MGWGGGGHIAYLKYMHAVAGGPRLFGNLRLIQRPLLSQFATQCNSSPVVHFLSVALLRELDMPRSIFICDPT